MKHARKDYDRIQDPAGIIPEAEPVFLLRGQDITAPSVVDTWAIRAREFGADMRMVEAAKQQAEAMRQWQRDHGMKIPDMPLVPLPHIEPSHIP